MQRQCEDTGTTTKEIVLGTFMKKEDLLLEAERLHVNLEGLTWPQMQKAVLAAKTSNGENIHYTDKSVEERKEKREVANSSKLPDINYIISVEVAPTKTQLLKYDEELDEDLITEEVRLSPHDAGNNYTTQTYKVRGTGRKVIAQSTAPKENCGIEYNPARDFVPRTIWKGQVGYIYSHPTLPCIKSLLIESGYYEDYRKEITNPKANYLWYAGSKILTIDINKTHQIFRDIEKKAKRANKD